MMLKDYWRNRLSGTEKQIYDRCLYAFSNGAEIVSCGDVFPEQINSIYLAIYNDHPELFQLPSSVQFRQTRFMFSSNIEIIAGNLFSEAVIRRYNSEWAALRSRLSGKINAAKTQIDKEKIICEYIVRNTKYEINNTYNQNAATVLFEHKGQCSGIAKATKLLCDSFGIDCMIVSGEAADSRTGTTGPHAWNIVRLDGKTYHLDVTFMLGANPSIGASVNFAYFNYSDTEIGKNHAWDRSQTPVCNTSFTADTKSDTRSDVRSDTKSDFGADMLSDKRTSSGGGVYISSLLDLKIRLKSAIMVGKKQLAFTSNLPVSDGELMKTVKNCCQEVVSTISKNIEMSISVTGKSVKITW